jgi:hypothetical protein
MRALRVIMGIIAAGQAVIIHDWILGLAGALLLVMGVFNIGCCGVNGCGVTYRQKETAQQDFEEVVNK